MNKKKTPVYMVGGLCVALVVVMIIMTAIIASGSFHLRKTRIVIKTGSDEKEYDGKPLTCDEWILSKGKISPEHTLEVDVRGEQTKAGVSDNVADVVIYDKGGMDVSDQYEIVVDAGKLEVTKKKITVQSYSSSKVYDGTEFSYKQAKLVKGRISRGHNLVTSDFASVSEPGIYPNTFVASVFDEEGNDISDRYEITYEYGELTIRYGSILIVSGSSTKEYDGTPLKDPSCEVAEGKLQNGHKIIMTATGTITTVGQCANIVSFSIVDEDGTDVTNRYDIIVNPGLLSVTPRTLVIRTHDVRRGLYSNPVTDDWELVEGELAPGDTLSIKTKQQYDRASEPGSWENSTVRVSVESSGTAGDLSNCYRIIGQYGRYEITE